MRRINKNLVKAVTLGLLLAVPYTAQAADYTESIVGNRDNYDNSIKTSSNKEYSYQFTEDSVLKLENLKLEDKNFGIGISNVLTYKGLSNIDDVAKITVTDKHKLDIIMSATDSEQPLYGIGISGGAVDGKTIDRSGGGLIKITSNNGKGLYSTSVAGVCINVNNGANTINIGDSVIEIDVIDAKYGTEAAGISIEEWAKSGNTVSMGNGSIYVKANSVANAGEYNDVNAQGIKVAGGNSAITGDVDITVETIGSAYSRQTYTVGILANGNGANVKTGDGSIIAKAENITEKGAYADGICGISGATIDKTSGTISAVATGGTSNEGLAARGVRLESGATANLGIVDISAKAIGGTTNGGWIDSLGVWTRGASEFNMAGGSISASADNENAAVYSILAADSSEVNINQGTENKVIINGDVESRGSSAINLDLNTADSVLNGAVTDNSNGIALGLDNGANWNVAGDSNVNSVNASGGVINVGEENVNITNLSGNSVDFNVNNLNSNINISTNNNSISLNGSSDITDTFDINNINAGMQDLADVMQIGSGNKAISVIAREGSVLGEISAKTDADGNIIASTVNEGTNSVTAGIGELANVAFMAWRAENDEMHQRMGELRSSKGEAGIWARMKRGESESGDMSIKNQYNTYQLGYDEKIEGTNWYIGGAISHTEGSSSFATGSGENKSTGFTMYGTYVADNGEYFDLSAKYARLDNEFDVFGRGGLESTGDYKNNGYAVSAEYGKRIETGNEFWIEPQVQLTYGHLSSANYTTSLGVKAAQDSMDSLVGRLGFAAGKDIKHGNVYVKASYLYDFDGDTSVTMTNGEHTRSYEQDLGGGWFEFGIGTNINLSETSHLYFDVERAVGGDIDTPWQWNAGVRFDF